MPNPNFKFSETTDAFIKWRQCLIKYNNNNELESPIQCRELYNIYDTLVENNINQYKSNKETMKQ